MRRIVPSLLNPEPQTLNPLGGFFSVALSVSLRCLDVIEHRAQTTLQPCSSDFPRMKMNSIRDRHCHRERGNYSDLLEKRLMNRFSPPSPGHSRLLRCHYRRVVGAIDPS
jgi:hypothetical protein